MDSHEWAILNDAVGVWMSSTDVGCALAFVIEAAWRAKCKVGWCLCRRIVVVRGGIGKKVEPL